MVNGQLGAAVDAARAHRDPDADHVALSAHVAQVDEAVAYLGCSRDVWHAEQHGQGQLEDTSPQFPHGVLLGCRKSEASHTASGAGPIHKRLLIYSPVSSECVTAKA